MLRARKDVDDAGGTERAAFADIESKWACLSVGLTFLACCILFAFVCDRGFDINDGAYYILSAADAGQYTHTLTEFGYALHPAFVAADGNLAVFRLMGAVFLLGCSTLFAFSACNAFLPGDRDWKLRACGIGAIVTSAFWQYGLWLPTPNYNLLNLSGLLLFFAGLLIGAPPTEVSNAFPRARRDIGAAAISGLGLCLTLLTKPPTSLSAVVVGLVWIVFVRPRQAWQKILAVAIVSASCYAAAIFFIDGNLAQFLARKSFSLRALAALGLGHDLPGLGQSLLGATESRTLPKYLSVGLGSLVFILAIGGWFHALKRGGGERAGALAVGCAFLVALVRAWDTMAPVPSPLFHVWRLVPSILAAALFLIAARNSEGRHGSRLRLICIAIIGIAPLIYSVGTNNTIALHASSAAVFWSATAILAAGTMPPIFRQRAVLGTAVLFTALTLGMLLGAIASPLPGAPPLWAQSQRLPLRDRMAVKVDARTRDYFAAFQAAAARQGLSKGTPIIDLTGEGPGMVLVLGGTAPGTPWLHYGGANVAAFSQLMLSQVPIERLRTAWVVTGTGSAAMREAGTLQRLGIDFPRRFDAVISRRAPQIGMAHTLWRPR